MPVSEAEFQENIFRFQRCYTLEPEAVNYLCYFLLFRLLCDR